MDINQLQKQFRDFYGDSSESIRVYFAPGRVNLIGEHTDYNDGYVFPCALDYGTYLVLRRNNSDNLQFKSADFDYETSVKIVNQFSKHGEEWVNYPLGVLQEFIKEDIELHGYDLMYFGNIPLGSGLSSSASIELVTARAFNEECSANFTMVELVKIGQLAENKFVGMNCGIMDQFAVGMGQKNAAIFLDCETLDHELVPIKKSDYKLIISNTNKPRKLIDSKYNERRSECEKALEMLNRAGDGFKNLGKIDWHEFESLQNNITDPVILQRARHVVSECSRVKRAVDALKADDLILFGKLMNESHDSLREDYEVTGMELDTMVNEARKVDGVIGSRMTGAGFGGCTVSLVHEDAIDTFIEQVGRLYKQETTFTPAFYVAEIGDGAKRLV
ncbi:MAG: galactokinase [Bacteroidetes bacterium]|nr:galactokinase [Bacteroidota bacterium]